MAIVKIIDFFVVIFLKNGGGIWDDIGWILVFIGGIGELEWFFNEVVIDVEGNIVKFVGGIFEIDIVNVFSFNNGLSLIIVIVVELLVLVEYGVVVSDGIN